MQELEKCIVNDIDSGDLIVVTTKRQPAYSRREGKGTNHISIVSLA